MSKKPTAALGPLLALKSKNETLVTNDTEAQDIVDALHSDTGDLVDIIREKGWQEAIDAIADIETAIEALSQYVKDKE